MNNETQNIEPSDQNFEISELVAACMEAIEVGSTGNAAMQATKRAGHAPAILKKTNEVQNHGQ